MEKNQKQGGFSDEVWNQKDLQEYLDGGLVFGYFSGNYFRRDTFDALVEKTLRKQGWSALEIAIWLTSTEARHFQDQVDKDVTLKMMRVLVGDWGFTNYAVKEGRVPAKPEPVKEVSQITAFMHCGKCLEELPAGHSPRSYASLEFGWTKAGFQLWCKRHEMNVLNADLMGNKVRAL